MKKLLEAAWGLIANANEGDWDKATLEWKEAAEKWRDEYFKEITMSKETMEETTMEDRLCTACSKFTDKYEPMSGSMRYQDFSWVSQFLREDIKAFINSELQRRDDEIVEMVAELREECTQDCTKQDNCIHSWCWSTGYKALATEIINSIKER